MSRPALFVLGMGAGALVVSGVPLAVRLALHKPLVPTS